MVNQICLKVDVNIYSIDSAGREKYYYGGLYTKSGLNVFLFIYLPLALNNLYG